MTTKWRWLAALVLIFGILVAARPTTFAQTKKPHAKDEAGPGDAVIEDAMAAHRMADFGHKYKSPECLLAAARLFLELKAVKLEAITENPTDAKGKDVDAKTVATEGFAAEADNLFDAARAMAAAQKLPGFDAMITAVRVHAERDEIEARKLRGVAGGARTVTRLIGPGQVHVYRFNFECNRPETISFRASFPMAVNAVRTDLGNVWISEIAQHGTQTKTPGGLSGTYAPVTVQVVNRSRQVGQYRLYVK